MKKLYKYLQLQFSYIGNFINWLILFITRENLKCYIKKEKINKELRIIGNGPSLNIKNVISDNPNIEYCMVNHACKTSEFKQLKPSMYIIADPAFIRNIHLDIIRETWEQLFQVDWDMTLFVPFYFYNKTKDLIKGSNLKVRCYHSVSFKGWQKLMFAMYNRNMAMPMAGNVLIAAIYVGILNGFSKIRLYGTDHSWTEQLRVNLRNQVCIRQVHYYDNDSAKLIPWNDETGKPFTMQAILYRFSEIFEQYSILEQYARYRNISIINMCPESFIDAFEKQHD